MKVMDNLEIKSISAGHKCGGACTGHVCVVGSAVGAAVGVVLFTSAFLSSLGKTVIYWCYNQVKSFTSSLWNFISYFEDYFFIKKNNEAV